MLNVNIVRVDGAVRVRLNKFMPGDRYPTQLLDFELVDSDRESDLALVERVALELVQSCAASRQREYPDLPGW